MKCLNWPLTVAVLCLLATFTTISAFSQMDAIYIEKGREFSKNGDEQMAILYFTKALAENPSNPDAIFSRGISKLAIGNFSSAIEDLLKSRDMDQYWYAPCAALCFAYYELNQFVTCIDYGEKSLSLGAPDEIKGSIYNTLAYAYKKKNRPETACKYYKLSVDYGYKGLPEEWIICY